MIAQKLPLFALVGGLIVPCSLYYYNTRSTIAPIKSAHEQKSLLAHNKKPTMLWDLHQVLFDRSIMRWIYITITSRALWQALFNLDWHTLKLCGHATLRQCKLVSAGVTSEEFITQARTSGNKDFEKFIRTICNEYYPNQDTAAILHQLHHLGYEQHVGSNIGACVYPSFAEKFSSICSLFTYYHVIRTPDPHKPFIKKPQQAFFKEYLRITGKKPEHVVFIDDSISNVRSAQACGIIALHYKNSTQLRQDLTILGILPPN